MTAPSPSRDPRSAAARLPAVAALSVLLAAATGATCGSGPSNVGSEADSKAASAGQNSGDTAAAPAPRAEFRLFTFARVLGTIAPCGCTTEPLGGLQYAFGYIESAGDPAQQLVLEPGSFLYPYENGPEWPVDEASWTQAHARADLLSTRFKALGDRLVSGVGPTDVISPKGTASLGDYQLPRVVANVELPEGSPEVPRHRLVELESNGMTWTVGVTAIVDPALPGSDKLGTVGAPGPAVAKEVAAMQKAGADFTVVLGQGDAAFAETLATSAEGLDLVVVGIPQGVEQERLGGGTKRVGQTFIVEPGARLQTMIELRLSVDTSSKKVADVSAWTVATPKVALEEELARAKERIAKFKDDPSADKSFVAKLEAERDRISLQLRAAPKGDAVVLLEPVKISCKLPVDAPAKKALAHYDATVASQNKTRFAGVKPPAAPKGTSGYAGVEACSDCHEEAVEFWKATPHGSAYETLVVDNKQFDLSCVGCHVTGFRKPGGSEVVENAGLIDVQCEVCHGPGDRHVEDGGDDLALIKLEVPEQLCATQCHTEEHSDTFAYEAYLRDIVGTGHADALRKKLGAGPTGHELREAGLAKAGGACKKM